MTRKIYATLLDPATKQRETVRIRPDQAGNLTFKKRGLTVPLDAKMAWNGGEGVLIDAERGIQIDYCGASQWIGIDGKKTYTANRDIRMRQVAYMTAGDYLKWAKIIMGIFIVMLLANTITIIVLAGKLQP